MSTSVDESVLSPVKRALLEIRELRSELQQARAMRDEPVAIVGVGCRLPGGVRNLPQFESLLWNGTDAITPIPPERWPLDAFYSADPDEPGRMTTRHGAFVEDVDRFDAEFFSISPREAASMDPQQRMLLETSWEALEDSGCAPGSLGGSRTGVFLGIANNDYGRSLFAQRDSIDAYFATGNAASVAAGRIAYFLGLEGPAVALDTACSSSLVALHLACQALRLRECDRALAAGVNLILTPEMNINFSKARMMAADGRCKAFDAAADGYVRGEGCVVVVLRRLSDALGAGERVLAVIRGTAVNQDGRSGGLTAPNGLAQEAVIRNALESARVAPADVGYVEAHGTGTPLGDPIEVGALARVLCAGRDTDNPLHLGSVKTNIGHLEAAAGLAGVLKTILVLRRREIPPHLHLRHRNPHVEWSGLPIDIPVAVTPWRSKGDRFIAGVSSFGFSGTNAHVLLERAADVVPSESSGPRTALLPLSARTPAALKAYAASVADVLVGEAEDFASLCHSAAVGRSHFRHRMAIVAKSPAEAAAALQASSSDVADAAVFQGVVDGEFRPRVAFLFTGQGAESRGMARELHGRFPLFRDCLEQLIAASPDGASIRSFLLDEDDGRPSPGASIVQPALFILQVALGRLWLSWGLQPVAVAGHSLGEFAAVVVSGAVDAATLLRVVSRRGELTERVAGGGSMSTLFAPIARVRELIAPFDRVSIAAENGPEHVVVSGPDDDVQSALDVARRAGVATRKLRVNFAAHSALVEPIIPEFRNALAGLTATGPNCAVFSTRTAARLGAQDISGSSHWEAHLREPVRFLETLGALQQSGVTHYLEIGPRPVLVGLAADCPGIDPSSLVASLDGSESATRSLFTGLARLYVDGADVDWSSVYPGTHAQRVLPTYPFQRQRHWLAPTAAPAADEDFWSAGVASLARAESQGPLDLNVSSYSAKWRLLEGLTVAHAIDCLRESGLFSAAGETLTVAEVLSRSGIGSSYRHLVGRWLDRLVDHGFLRRQQASFIAVAALPAPELDRLWREADEELADNQPLLDYVRHCGSLVNAVLRGRESPLETLFPGGSEHLATGLYEKSATMRYINQLAAAAADAIGRIATPARKLRVMEVGAGTGGTTSSMLARLPAQSTQYVFTDVSQMFLDRAAQRFRDYPGMRFALFDLERDPAAQGFSPGTFDLIVSANAVHACTDLRAALRRLHSLLAPGGVLLLVESTEHLAWFDFTTGLIEGWQQFADDLRVDNPLLPAPVWIEALKTAGFEAAIAAPGEGSAAELLGQHVLLARVPGRPVAGRVADATLPHSTAVVMETSGSAAAIRETIESLPSGERLAALRDYVRSYVMRILKLDPDTPPSSKARLMDLGFDSLMAVQLRNELANGLGLEKALPASLMFDQPTIEALAAHLHGRLWPQRAESHPLQAAEGVSILDAGTVAGMTDEQIEALLGARMEAP